MANDTIVIRSSVNWISSHVTQHRRCMQSARIQHFYHPLLLSSSSTTAGINIVSQSLKSRYVIWVASNVKWVLGVKISLYNGHDGFNTSLSLSQSLYIDGIFRRFGMQEGKAVSTSVVKMVWISISSGADKLITNEELYENIFGPPLYLTFPSPPD